MGIIGVINIEPPSKEIIFDRVRIFSDAAFRDTEIASYIYNTVQFFALKYGATVNKDNFNVVNVEEAKWTLIENNEKNVPDQYLRNIAWLIADNFELVSNKHDTSSLSTIHIDKNFINYFDNGIKIAKNKKNKNYQIAVSRFISSFRREELLDSVLDCCSAIEAFYQVSDELRLRIALITYQLLPFEKKDCMRLIYEMYGIRNDFIHGNDIPDLCSSDISKYQQILSKALRIPLETGKMPDFSQLNRDIIEKHE